MTTANTNNNYNQNDHTMNNDTPKPYYILLEYSPTANQWKPLTVGDHDREVLEREQDAWWERRISVKGCATKIIKVKSRDMTHINAAIDRENRLAKIKADRLKEPMIIQQKHRMDGARHTIRPIPFIDGRWHFMEPDHINPKWNEGYANFLMKNSGDGDDGIAAIARGDMSEDIQQMAIARAIDRGVCPNGERDHRDEVMEAWTKHLGYAPKTFVHPDANTNDDNN